MIRVTVHCDACGRAFDVSRAHQPAERTVPECWGTAKAAHLLLKAAERAGWFRIFRRAGSRQSVACPECFAEAGSLPAVHRVIDAKRKAVTA